MKGRGMKQSQETKELPIARTTMKELTESEEIHGNSPIQRHRQRLAADFVNQVQLRTGLDPQTSQALALNSHFPGQNAPSAILWPNPFLPFTSCGFKLPGATWEPNDSRLCMPFVTLPGHPKQSLRKWDSVTARWVYESGNDRKSLILDHQMLRKKNTFSAAPSDLSLSSSYPTQHQKLTRVEGQAHTRGEKGFEASVSAREPDYRRYDDDPEPKRGERCILELGFRAGITHPNGLAAKLNFRFETFGKLEFQTQWATRLIGLPVLSGSALADVQVETSHLKTLRTGKTKFTKQYWHPTLQPHKAHFEATDWKVDGQGNFSRLIPWNTSSYYSINGKKETAYHIHFRVLLHAFAMGEPGFSQVSTEVMPRLYYWFD